MFLASSARQGFGSLQPPTPQSSSSQPPVAPTMYATSSGRSQSGFETQAPPTPAPVAPTMYATSSGRSESGYGSQPPPPPAPVAPTMYAASSGRSDSGYGTHAPPSPVPAAPTMYQASSGRSHSGYGTQAPPTPSTQTSNQRSSQTAGMFLGSSGKQGYETLSPPTPSPQNNNNKNQEASTANPSDVVATMYHRPSGKDGFGVAPPPNRDALMIAMVALGSVVVFALALVAFLVLRRRGGQHPSNYPNDFEVEDVDSTPLDHV